MSTTMRNLRLARDGEPFTPGRAAPTPAWRRALADLAHWAVAKPAIASLTLSIAYLVALAALVGVLAASAMDTAIGVGVLVLFGAMVVVCVAVAIYTVIPERTPS